MSLIASSITLFICPGMGLAFREPIGLWDFPDIRENLDEKLRPELISLEVHCFYYLVKLGVVHLK